MQLQLRMDRRYHGFCIVVVRRGRVVRCHELPCEGELDDFFNARLPVDWYFWLDSKPLNAAPKMFGTLIAIRRKWSVITYRPALFRCLLDEIATVTFADRESFLRVCQQSL